jgi:hypothetical protein
VAKDLPYLVTNKNIGTLFEKIEKAKVPDAFTTRFLAETIGLKGTNDRQLISLLKKLGFLDSAGKPSAEYSRLKNRDTAKRAIADGIRKAYAPLFEANEAAYTLPNDQLKGLIAQVSGADEGITKLITYTFAVLAKLADFTQTGARNESNGGDVSDDANAREEPPMKEAGSIEARGVRFNPDFRFNIEIHLPSSGTEETYLAIFNALRKSLG